MNLKFYIHHTVHTEFGFGFSRKLKFGSESENVTGLRIRFAPDLWPSLLLAYMTYRSFAASACCRLTDILLISGFG